MCSPAPTTTVFGYGSLLSEASCKRTCPSCRRHRLAVLPGWRRYFSLVSVSQIRNGNADEVAKKIAALAVSPVAPQQPSLPIPRIVGCLFEIDTCSLPDLVRREHRYEMRTLPCYEIHDFDSGIVPVDQAPVMAVVFVESTDEAYRKKCDAKDEEVSEETGGQERKNSASSAVKTVSSSSTTSYQNIVGQFYAGSLWHRADILPVDKYLHFCIKAAKDLGGIFARENFLDTSYLADRKTSIREYLSLPPAFVRTQQHQTQLLSPPWGTGMNQDIAHHILSFSPDSAARMACVCRDWLQITASDPRRLFALLELQYKCLPITRPNQVPKLTAAERKGCAKAFDKLGATLHMIRARLRSMTACAAASAEMLDILRAGLHDPHPVGGEGGEEAADEDEANDANRTLALRFVFYKWFLLCKQIVPQLYANHAQTGNNPEGIFLRHVLPHCAAHHAAAVLRCALDVGPREDFASHLLSGFAYFTDEHGIVQTSPNEEDPTILRTAAPVHSPAIVKALKTFSELDAEVPWAAERLSEEGGGRRTTFSRLIPICLTDLKNATIADLQNRLERRWNRYTTIPGQQGFDDTENSLDCTWIEDAAVATSSPAAGAEAGSAPNARALSARAALHSMLGRMCTMLSFRGWNAGAQEYGVFLGFWAVQHWLVARDLGRSPEAAASVGLGDAWAKLGLNLLDIGHDGCFLQHRLTQNFQPGRIVLRAAETALKAANACYARAPSGHYCFGREARTLNDLGRLFRLAQQDQSTDGSVEFAYDLLAKKCRLANERALELRTEVFGPCSLPVSQSHLNLVDCYDSNAKEGRALRRYHSWTCYSIRKNIFSGSVLQPLLNNARHLYVREILDQWSKTQNTSARSARELAEFLAFVGTFEDGNPSAEAIDAYFAAVHARGGDVEHYRVRTR